MDTHTLDVRTQTACDHHEFDNLVRRHRAAIHRLARRLAPAGIEPEDVVQETFIRAFRGLPHFRGECGAFSWLYRIALNVLRSQRSKHSVDPLANTSAQDEGAPPYLDTIASVEDLEGRLVLRRTVAQALAALPDTSRQVIVLRHLRGLDYAEIAAAMGAPLGTIESRLFRARRKLRPLLEPLPAGRRALVPVGTSLPGPGHS